MSASTPTLIKIRTDTEIRKKSPSDPIDNGAVAEILDQILDTSNSVLGLSATSNGTTSIFNFQYNGPAIAAVVTAASPNAMGLFCATVTPPVPGGSPGYLSIQYSAPPVAAVGGATDNLKWICALYSVSGNASGTGTSTPGTLPINQSPVVSAGPNQNIAGPVVGVSLSGTATDGDGTISFVQWSQVSGPAGGAFANSAQLATTFSTPTVGIYVLRLTAFDDLGASSSATVTINIF